MSAKRTTVRRRLMAAFMVTSGVVLVLAAVAFLVYEVVSFRGLMVRSLMLRAEMLAANSTAALAFENEADAKELLSALQKDPHMIAACLYDRNGRVFAVYPDDAPRGGFPKAPAEESYAFEASRFVLFKPVMQESRRLGTVYFESDLTGLNARFHIYALV